jgi:hypothetical protein
MGTLQCNLCYHTVDERFRLQEQNLSGIFSGPMGSKNLFWIALAKAAA